MSLALSKRSKEMQTFSYRYLCHFEYIARLVSLAQRSSDCTPYLSLECIRQSIPRSHLDKQQDTLIRVLRTPLPHTESIVNLT